MLGISPDKPAKLTRFRDAEGLTFPLLSDEGAKVATAYGVRSLLGSARRSIFLIDRAGKVRYRHEDPLSLSYRSVEDLLLALRESGLA